jgi:hypothetical protein
MIGGGVRVDGDGALDQRLGPRVVASLMGGKAEQVERVGLIGRERENAFVQRLRLGKPPGPMMADRRRQQRRINSICSGPIRGGPLYGGG